MEAAEVEVALTRALRRAEGRPGEVRSLQRVTGGATKRTWSFEWHTDGGVQPLILQCVDSLPARRGGPPKLSAKEDAALMTAARRAGVAAPVVRHVLEVDDGLGDGYVTERVDGETLGRKLVHGPAFAEARSRLATQCGATLAMLHRMPCDRVGFLQRLSPADELGAYGARLAEHDLGDPALAYAVRWVRENLPTRWDVGVVHADFRTGNLIVGPDGLRCVLDWEIARIGDPMQDLAVLCMRTWRFGGAAEVGGFGSRDDLYAAYEAAGGRVDATRVRFWEAFSNLKWAISCVRRGLAARPDGRPASLELAAVGRRLEEPLWDFFTLVGSTP